MTSRLDRLFVLLEAGTGAATRKAAARQLGEVQKAHPEELHRLLGRLMKYLRSSAWETRVAASQAVEEILSNVPEWNPLPGEVKKEDVSESDACGRLRCSTFDIEKVLQNGAHLMASEGNEFDLGEETMTAAELKEHVSRQRKQLNAQLGLDVASDLGVDLCGALYTSEDICQTPRPPVNKEPARKPIQDLVPLVQTATTSLSSREINLAKRRARQAAFSKQKSREEKETPTPPAEKKIKLELPEDTYVDVDAPTPNYDGTWGDIAGWPLDNWCAALQAQLFSSSWEARHGAATALRALLRSKITHSAGKQPGMSLEQMEQSHQDWLEDMSLRLICVLALDRFGDFVSDQVVAPVRETSAQTLGVALSMLQAGRVQAICEVLSKLAEHPQWEARHGAMLGLKYLLAAREEEGVGGGALARLVRGVWDPAEDVAGVCAAALQPAAARLLHTAPAMLPALLLRLWQLLQEQDDLAGPANSYMALLASLMSLPEAAELLHPIDLADVLPRLWPYLDHNTSSIRKATLQTLCTITKPMKRSKDKLKEGESVVESNLNWTPELLQEAMRHIYQRILFEHVEEIQDIAMQVWRQVVTCARLYALLLAACPVLALWLCAAMTPPRTALEPPLRLPTARAPATNADAAGHNKERRLRSKSPPGGVGGGAAARWFVGGAESVGQAARDRTAVRARVKAADALGLLSCYLVQPAPGVEYKSEDESPIECYVKVLITYLKSGSALQRLVASLVISYWARHTVSTNMYPPRSLPNASSASAKETTQPVNGEIETKNASIDAKLAANVTETTSPSEGGSVRERDISELAPPSLVSVLHTALNQILYYDEVALNCNRILQEARDLVAMMKHYKLPVEEDSNNIVRLEQVISLCSWSREAIARVKVKRAAAALEPRRAALATAAGAAASEHAALHVAVQAGVAAACAQLAALPARLNPVLRPLMEAARREPSEPLQREAARALAALLARLPPPPANKLLANLRAALRCDPELTPRANLSTISNSEEAGGGDSGSGDSGGEGKPDYTDRGPAVDALNGILTLWEQRLVAERNSPRRGRPGLQPAPHPAPAPALLPALTDDLLPDDEAQKQLKIQRRGATLALTIITEQFGEHLPEKLPKLWEIISDPFLRDITDEDLENQDVDFAEDLISKLQVFETVCPYLHESLLHRLTPAQNGSEAGGGAGSGAGRGAVGAAPLLRWSRAARTALRHMAARALAALALRTDVLAHHAHTLLCALSESPSRRVRGGAAEALWRLVEALQLRIVPYIPLFVLPLLGRMSDQCECVRAMSTRCFASLIQLMPLDGAVPPPADLPPELRAKIDRDKEFLDRLFNPKSIKDYEVPVPISAQLRGYQQAGVNWLRFLHESGLHGVLCDDMGLGKTLQCLCVLAGATHERAARRLPALPSLVLCPPTLTGHWVFEVNKFVSNKHLNPLQYVGPPLERERLKAEVSRYNLVVASYDIMRKDIDFFRSIHWNYCILDEGHIIKNGKTKAFKAIKQIVANHRLILSGTPIQNNVVELWSLFEFLMPGLLGTSRQFQWRYARPILQARDPRASPAQLQAAALACEALHRQVLPFLLRRVKEDVLEELPPKITQDYYCDLSPLQRRLYEDFSRQRGHSHSHVFQVHGAEVKNTVSCFAQYPLHNSLKGFTFVPALHYLQAVCNHPKLVAAQEPAGAVLRALQLSPAALQDIRHAAKLPALKQLLLDCGIGTTSPEAETETSPVLSQHRALIFCQLTKMLDIIENDLLKVHLPGVTYLRLDGSVPPAQRHSLVTTFNNDPTIDLLLLTTKVGGLGLNLTGADTVIFVEHDWNPSRDAQAMDRAHRLGQRRVVSVYRLLTRHTLEEKIMGLQKFKQQTANTVISSANAAIETMGTDQLLDLMQPSDGQGPSGSWGQAGSSGVGVKAVLDTLPDLWDDKQYEDEYDMAAFMQGLKKINPS